MKAGQLEPDYASRFGHPTGIVGQFLAFFRLTKEDVLAVCEFSKPVLIDWFTRRLPVQSAPQYNNTSDNSSIASASSSSSASVPTPLYASATQQIEAWNHIAVNLGRDGFPMAERLPIALSTTYKHLQGQPFVTVFEVLEADEHLPSSQANPRPPVS